MGRMTVWTKQNEAVLDQLENTGRFIANEKFIRKELDDTADIMLLVYNWLADHMPAQDKRPEDVRFPVWVSPAFEATMIPEKGYAVLELEMDEELITFINVEKWTVITNYAYLPEDKKDAERVSRLLEDMGVTSARAIMTNFYPDVKDLIMSSWDRLFNTSPEDAGKPVYGLIWEVKKEWIRKVTRA